MSDFTPLREAVDTLAGRSPSPDFGELKRRATRRGRRRIAMAAAATAAVRIAGIVAVADGDTSGAATSLRRSGNPRRPRPVATVRESAEPTPTTVWGLSAQLDAIVAQVPGWSIADTLPPTTTHDYAFNGPCSGRLGKGAEIGQLTGASARPASARMRFPSEARASDAAARFVENLESCTATAWRTQPIAQTGAVLASSADAVAWIQQTRDRRRRPPGAHDRRAAAPRRPGRSRRMDGRLQHMAGQSSSTDP